MSKLQKMQPSDHSILTQVLFGQTSPTPISPDDLKADVAWKDETLNDSQKDAVCFALASPEVALIHGKILLGILP
jgi:DNA polymerase alpha-associated DNA helicase A